MREALALRLVRDEPMSRPDPLTPPDCNLQELPFMPLHITKLLSSELLEDSTGDEFKAAIILWCRAWQQVPAASVPNDDRKLAKLAGVHHAEWPGIRKMALRGFIECSDGRLYHPVVAKEALKAWMGRLSLQRRSAAGNAKRHKKEFDPGYFDAQESIASAMLERLNQPITSEPLKLAFFPRGDETAPSGRNNGSLGESLGEAKSLLRVSVRDREESSSRTRARKPMAEPGEEAPSHPGFDPDDDEPERETSPADPPPGSPGRELEPAGEASDANLTMRWFHRLLEVAGPGLVDPILSGKLHTTAVELSRWRRAGVDLEAHAVPVVRELTRTPRPHDPIDTWKFFTKAVTKVLAQSQQNLEVPDAARNPVRQRSGFGRGLDALDELIRQAEIHEGKRPADDAF